MTGAVGLPAAGVDRPTTLLRLRHLVTLSVYWLGINAIWAGLGDVLLPRRVEQLLGIESSGTGLAIVATAGMLIAIAVQPTVGALSDYTQTRWGRRKPFIAIGATLDVVFLLGIGLSDSFLALIAFVVLLQFSSNLAQGPFQGYVPDLVPAPQVASASGLMGLMIVLGQIAGTGIATIGIATGQFVLPLLLLGGVQLATAIVLLATVDEGRAAPSRDGRSWAAIARATWGLDLLRERSFLWLVVSRLFFLAGPAIVIGFALYYLERSHALDAGATSAWLLTLAAVVGVTTAIATFPAARLSDRIGRKRVIQIAALVGMIGIAGLVVAPDMFVALPFLVLVGVSAGSFLAVDWALMTDIIPKATTGRYMGISNVATATAGPLGLTVGGLVLDAVTRTDPSAGPRAAFAVGIAFLVLAVVTLRPVDERRRE